jgi:hypothetical protein
MTPAAARDMTPAAARGMTERRRALAAAAVLALVLGSLVEIATGRDDWPLSSYPMYARADLDPTIVRYELTGVAEDGRVAPLGEAATFPIVESRIDGLLRRIGGPEGARDRPAVLAALFEVYEGRRRAGALEGPPLSALRLERWIWRRRADGSTAPVSEPDEREAVCEVARRGAGAPRRP